MTRSISNPRLALLCAAVLLASTTPAAALTKADYDEGKTRISDTYKADRTACASFTRNARDVCVEEGRAKQKIARAELEYSYSGTPKDQNKLWVATAEAAYAVAKEKCDDQSGNAKSVCRKEAKAIEIKTLADAKLVRKVDAAKADAVDDNRDAGYRVATQKCDAMSGEAKDNCMSVAKIRYGKS